MRAACISYSLLFLMAFVGSPAEAQSERFYEVGRPFELRTFAKGDLPNQKQNWAVAQNNQGIMFFANDAGVLEFDGTQWRLIPVANGTTVFSLAASKEGVIYVGARNDFGYLAPDSSGALRYVSLLPYVNPDERDFNITWGTHATKGAVYFHTRKYIFRWDGKRILSWSSSQRLHTSFSVNDRFYVRRDSLGLLEMDGDSLRLINDGARFFMTRIFAMMPIDEQHILIGAQKEVSGPIDLYRYDGRRLEELETDMHAHSRQPGYTFYHGAALGNGYFALATLDGGVFVIDESGALIESLDWSRQVPDDVNFVFCDRQGGVWLAHDVSGISHIGDAVQLSNWTDGSGVRGSGGGYGPVNATIRHQGALYAATDIGLLKLKGRTGTGADFFESPFADIEFTPSTGLHWSLASIGDELLVATEMGVYSVRDDRGTRVAFDVTTKPVVLLPSRHHAGRVYVGMDAGVGFMVKSGRAWKQTFLPGAIVNKVTSMAEAADGAIWVATDTPQRELWRLVIDEAGQLESKAKMADKASLQAGNLSVDYLDGDLAILAPPYGVFRYDALAAEAFQLDRRLTGRNTSEDSLKIINVANPHQVWFIYAGHAELLERNDTGEFERSTPEVLRLPTWSDIRQIYTEEDGVSWISMGRDFLRYDPSRRANARLREKPSLLIRGAAVLWSNSMQYGGAASEEGASRRMTQSRLPTIELKHSDNDLRFDYALLDYNRIGRVEYQFRLTGHDDGWSTWATGTSAYYRNIEPGSHEFMVRARINGAALPQTASLSLIIHNPWYWTWWMRCLYVLVLAIPVVNVVRYRRAKKVLQELEKERTLNERLNRANEQLRSANRSLEQANRMKDEFLANASHELRTPLTAILGFTSVLKEEISEDNQEFLGLIDENGKRLLQTINSLLDLAKLRAGMFELNMRRVDVGEKTEEVVDLLAQLAKNRNLFLRVIQPPGRAYACLDDHSFERILYNLIGNAIKFTLKGGVTIRVECDEDTVQVHVQDTGIGIDESFIPFLFDEFKQEPANGIRSEGSGLGLTITAQLVELLNGTISVKSKKGKGSTFTVAFPLDKVEEWTSGNDSNGARSEKEPSSALH